MSLSGLVLDFPDRMPSNSRTRSLYLGSFRSISRFDLDIDRFEQGSGLRYLNVSSSRFTEASPSNRGIQPVTTSDTTHLALYMFTLKPSLWDSWIRSHIIWWWSSTCVYISRKQSNKFMATTAGIEVWPFIVALSFVAFSAMEISKLTCCNVLMMGLPKNLISWLPDAKQVGLILRV